MGKSTFSGPVKSDAAFIYPVVTTANLPCNAETEGHSVCN